MKIKADRFTYNVIVGGDVNADGSVNIADVSNTYAAIFGDELSGVNRDAALLSATSQKINILDVMAVLKVVSDGDEFSLGKDYMPNVKYYGEDGVDFIMDIDHDNDIKILQLTDTQIMAMNYARTSTRFLSYSRYCFNLYVLYRDRSI